MIMDLNLFHLMKGMQTFADGLVIGNRRRVRSEGLSKGRMAGSNRSFGGAWGNKDN
jgi:hypothetical protein